MTAGELNQIKTVVTLTDGREVTAIVTTGPILVDVAGRACLAHHRWFDRTHAAAMIAVLRQFVDG